jgi:hypothetical protein
VPVRRAAALVATALALLGCKKTERRDDAVAASGAPPPVPSIDAAAPARDLEAEAADRAMQAITVGAVRGESLLGFAPTSLAGVARSDLLDHPFAVAAAYQLPDGQHANLDVKNSFRRGGIDLEDQLMRACKRAEKVAGHVACVIVKPDRTAFHWDLADRLTVDLSAPDEKLARRMAKELPLTELAALSRAESTPAPETTPSP